MSRNFPKVKEIQISVVTKLDIKKKNYASILRRNKAYKKKDKDKNKKTKTGKQNSNGKLSNKLKLWPKGNANPLA